MAPSRLVRKRQAGRHSEYRGAASRRHLSAFPLFFRTTGRHVLVVGNGEEALAKLRLLSECDASLIAVADRPSRELAAFLIQSGIRHEARPYAPAFLDGVALVFAASGDRELDSRIVRDARLRAIPVNAVDSPDICDFFTPALVNRAPVAVAIGTEGAGPVLTQIIRARIEALLPTSLGRLAELARSYRETVESLVPRGAARRSFWRAFFSGPVADALGSGDEPDARRAVSALLERTGEPGGFVSLIGAGPGAPDLLTLRGHRALMDADVILHDRLVPMELVAMGRRDARRVPVGKTGGGPAISQKAIHELMIREARAGHRVVRLKSGDPMIFGRAGEEIAALRKAGIRHEVVPGVTAALAAAAAISLPLTLRDVSSAVIFATGHDMRGQTLPGWANLALDGATVAVYMGRSVAARVARGLRLAGLGDDTPVAIVESASQDGQSLLAGSLLELSALPPGRDSDRPALILIGRALAAADLSAATPLAASTEKTLAA